MFFLELFGKKYLLIFLNTFSSFCGLSINMELVEDEDPQSFRVNTLFTTAINFTKTFAPKPHNSWAPKKIPIFIEQSDWTFTYMMIFLNELRDFISIDHSYVKRTTQKGTKAYFHYRYFDINKKWHIYLTVSIDKISVKVSTNFLRDKWIPESQILESNIGAQNKPKKVLMNKNTFVFINILNIQQVQLPF